SSSQEAVRFHGNCPKRSGRSGVPAYRELQTPGERTSTNSTRQDQVLHVQRVVLVFSGNCSPKPPYSVFLQLSEVDFLDSVLVLGFSEELNQFLLQLYQQHHSQIRSILNQLVHSQPAYHNLEWRLDVQLASRSVRQQVVPTVTTRLQLTSGSELSSRVLQIDPSTLLHIISSLEAALAAVKTGHARRILRNIK
uniref:COMM domain containing 2 n=1 Tax=Nothobranchius furzeri TaxID=105023 RepID=A0A8C6PSU2_NOTFU